MPQHDLSAMIGNTYTMAIGNAIERIMKEPSEEEKRKAEDQRKQDEQKRQEKEREDQQAAKLREATIDSKNVDLSRIQELVGSSSSDILESSIMQALAKTRTNQEVELSARSVTDDVINLVGNGREGQTLARLLEDRRWVREPGFANNKRQQHKNLLA